MVIQVSTSEDSSYDINFYNKRLFLSYIEELLNDCDFDEHLHITIRSEQP